MNIYPIHNTISYISADNLAALIPFDLWQQGGLIEVIVDDYDMGELELLLPSLAACSHRGRWLAWIASPHRFTSSKLASYSVNPGRLLQVYPGQKDRNIHTLSKALSTGRCGAVMAWSTQCNEAETTQLKQAAYQGNAVGILLIKSSQSQTQTHKSHCDLQIAVTRYNDDLKVTLSIPYSGQKNSYLFNKEKQDNTIPEMCATMVENHMRDNTPTQMSFF